MPPKDKNKDKKPEGWNFDPIEAFVVLIFLGAIVTGVVPSLLDFITSGELSFYGIELAGLFNFFREHVQLFKILGYILAGVGAIATFVYNKKSDAVWREEKAKVYPENMKEPSPESVTPTPNPMTEKWKAIVAKAESENSSDWRLAIIEADIILDDLLQKLGLPGDTMGEKLKAVEKSDFTTIEYAWEAHKARNFIAHEGSNFLLSQRETRRIISLYEAVFKEFYLI